MSDKSRERFAAWFGAAWGFAPWSPTDDQDDARDADITWDAWQARDAEVKELTKERDEYKHAATAEADNADEQRANNVRLKAEVKELVRALDRISNLRYGVEGDCGAVKIAEDAIAKHEGGR